MRWIPFVVWAGVATAAPVTVQARAEMTVRDFLQSMSDQFGFTVLVMEGVPLVAKMGAGFRHSVPRPRVLDFVAAVLAFYELDTRRGGERVLLVGKRTLNGSFKIRRYRTVDVRVRVLGQSASSTLVAILTSAQLRFLSCSESMARRLRTDLATGTITERVHAARILNALSHLGSETRWALWHASHDENQEVRTAAKNETWKQVAG